MVTRELSCLGFFVVEWSPSVEFMFLEQYRMSPIHRFGKSREFSFLPLSLSRRFVGSCTQPHHYSAFKRFPFPDSLSIHRLGCPHQSTARKAEASATTTSP
ncbi:hypothetical protein Mapa_015816 [Marchantia paleacea]|nr:hypothetical protein Mapa_015816 [Marchantia paleacea]